jgi:hypothetical protein
MIAALAAASLTLRTSTNSLSTSPLNPPVEIERCNGNYRVAAEDIHGNVSVLILSTRAAAKLSRGLSSSYPAVTAVPEKWILHSTSQNR